MNYYTATIEVLAEVADSESLLFEIAKIKPSAVVRAYENLNGKGWMAEARQMVKDGRKIEAIKYCREKTGLGLKEAKEAVESL